MLTKQTIRKASKQSLAETHLPFLGRRLQGKVRDIYLKKDQRILITTDRQSAFNAILGLIPFKGQVLNLLSTFWFEQTKRIIPNHMISVPHANIMITRNCQSVPIEMVVRGYLTGVTITSPWGNYQKGERVIYGIKFPEGMKKNQKLPQPIITPTTHGGAKGSHADERLTRDEIIKKKLVNKKIYEEMEKKALELFNFGTKICQKHGLILVDTKYEFGMYKGKLMLIDEIHTPDSSRFWIAKTYTLRIAKNQEPDNYDKEFLRLWYAKRGYLGDGPPPTMPQSLMLKVAQRYISVYEKITGRKFKSQPYPLDGAIEKILRSLYE